MATLKLLSHETRPDAIFCANDLMAIGCYDVLKENGIRVGSDIAVLGYDDQEVAEHLFPTLSTVLLPHREMGTWTVQRLVKDEEIKKIFAILSKSETKKIRSNQILNIVLDNTDKNNKKILSLLIPVSKTKKIQIVKNLETDQLKKEEIVTNLTKRLVLKEGVITSSLYKSATKQKISANVIIEFARLYGFQVDFQRDIRKNDSYQIIYETFIDENNEVFSTGEIIYANLVLRGQSNQLYFYPDKKFFGHYDENGKKNLDETYYVCDDECKDLHPPDRRGVPYVCNKLGRLKESKKS